MKKIKRASLTSDEKAFDANVRTGIMLLGPIPEPHNPNAFRHVCRTNKDGRKGQLCRITRRIGFNIQIEFEDGFTAVVGRQQVRRPRD